MHPFEAMAEPVRRRIIELLASGEVRSGHIARTRGAPAPADVEKTHR
jgi:hypothetical protein